MTESHPRISIIVGSTRPVRIGRQLADSIVSLLGERADSAGIELNILDLREIGLPLLDEPKMAAMGDYRHDHTKAWAQEIVDSDALIFLTPQYNSGYPASLKNAIDYLLAEWEGKPAAIISYGAHGGDRSAEQLSAVLRFVRTALVDDQPQLVIERGDYSAAGDLADPEAVVARYREAIEAMAANLESTVAVPVA